MVGVEEAGWGGLHLGRLVQMLLPGRIEFRFFSLGGGTDECRGWGASSIPQRSMVGGACTRTP